MPILRQAIEDARTFRPLEPDEVKALLAKTTEAARFGRFERYKTTSSFDSTSANPDWLGL
jgi:hypothetical protein